MIYSFIDTSGRFGEEQIEMRASTSLQKKPLKQLYVGGILEFGESELMSVLEAIDPQYLEALAIDMSDWTEYVAADDEGINNCFLFYLFVCLFCLTKK